MTSQLGRENGHKWNSELLYESEMHYSHHEYEQYGE